MRALRAPVAFDGERFLDGGATVLVEDGSIVGVESSGHDLPDGVEVATYDGTLLPGLIDTHVHLVADGTPGSLEIAPTLTDDELAATVTRTLSQHAAAGATTVRDLGDTRYVTLGFRDALAPGVPRIVAAGPPFTTLDGHCHYLGGVVDGPEAIRAAMAEHLSRGIDVVKVMASGGMLTPGSDQLGVQFSPADLGLVVRLGHEAGLQVLAHAHSQRGAWHALETGVDGIEHFSCLTEDGMRTTPELLDAVAAAGVVVNQTTGWDRSLINPANMPPALKLLVEKMKLDPDAMVAARGEQARQLRAHGITIVSGVDAGISPPKQHGNVWRCVVELVEAGFPVAEALATATSVAADACRLTAVTGRLRAGLAADLLVVDGDVRGDANALGRPLAVLVRGEPPAP
jgi:imidazolonepropionase-like amidohydrolase